LELAQKMYEEGFLIYTNCNDLSENIELVLSEKNKSLITKYTPGNSKLFGTYLNQIFI
jgi:hypothetical protein